MKTIPKSNEDYARLQSNIIVREKLEKQATVAITSDILSKLNISVENLPQKCQHLLQRVADIQSNLEIDQLDSNRLCLRKSRVQSEKLEDEYEILKLEQKNAMLQTKIDTNKKSIDELRRELACSKELLASQNPNPGNIQDCIRQWKQRVASYEDNCNRAKMKFSKLSVPDEILPMSLSSLMATLDSLQREADALRKRADDVILTQQARDTLRKLRK